MVRPHRPWPVGWSRVQLLLLELDELFEELLDEPLDELFEEPFEEPFELELEELLELEFDDRLELLLADRFEELLELALDELFDEPLALAFEEPLLLELEELFEELLEDRFGPLRGPPLKLPPLDELFTLELDELLDERLPLVPPVRVPRSSPKPTAVAAVRMPRSQPLKKRCTGVGAKLLSRELLRLLRVVPERSSETCIRFGVVWLWVVGVSWPSWRKEGRLWACRLLPVMRVATVAVIRRSLLFMGTSKGLG